MNNLDYTLTSSLTDFAKTSRPLLSLTIAWHPDRERIGEQFIGLNEEGCLEVSRFSPSFLKNDSAALPIGHGSVSRDPVRIVRDGNDGIAICPPKSRMLVEVNGLAVHEATYLSAEQVQAGVILCLGRTVFICLHWMRCLPKFNPVDGFVGIGTSAIVTRDLIRLAAANDATVLLLGETGTGKEIAAIGIHALSKRAPRKMVSVNMAALNESLAAADLFGASKGAYTGALNTRSGFFAEAEQSTLFLDEIGNTPASVQPMLLRVLENKEYRPLGSTKDLASTARIIAATDQDLYGKGFNQALVRRLESFIIRIPPLRERREDIGILILYLLKQSAHDDFELGQFPASFISEILNFSWPGNIRQLKHLVNRAMIALQLGEPLKLANLIETAEVVVTASAAIAVKHPLAAHDEDDGEVTTIVGIERKKLSNLSEQDVVDAMEKHRWTIQYAAQDLGISRPSMYKLIDSNQQIRRVEQIPADEIRQNLDQARGDVEQCASLLKTPSEALRRHLRGLGLV